MNVENILKVADAIEQHSIPELGFNMGEWVGDANVNQPDMSGHNCGTVACIAGWTCAVLTDDINKVYDLDYRELGALLGINYDQAKSLFIPSYAGVRLSLIGQDQAIRTLRNLAITGNVDWTIEAPISEPSHG